MLQLRVYGENQRMAEVVGRLNAIPGARHVSLTSAGHDEAALITADLRPSAADPALEMLGGLGDLAG